MVGPIDDGDHSLQLASFPIKECGYQATFSIRNLNLTLWHKGGERCSIQSF